MVRLRLRLFVVECSSSKLGVGLFPLLRASFGLWTHYTEGEWSSDEEVKGVATYSSSKLAVVLFVPPGNS